MPDFTLADILGAQAGAPGPVYEGGPRGNVTLADVLGPSWLERAQQQAQADAAAYQRGGVPELLADTGQTQELAGGFGGNIKAYHGSPYDFAKFDLSKVGTGEGAQAYGHGLYFAENPAVANDYRNRLGRNYQWNDASEINALLPQQYQGSMDSARRIISEVEKSPIPSDFLKEYDIHPSLVPAYQKAIDMVSGKGRMYEVNINAKPEQFLDWEKPLQQQPEAVRKAIGSEGTGREAYQRAALNYNQMGGMPEVSRVLNEAGIPGIKYLDQGSRVNATNLETSKMLLRSYEGRLENEPNNAQLRAMVDATRREIADAVGPTSNYVVFNPDIVDILKKYGLAGLTMAGVLQSQAEPPAP